MHTSKTIAIAAFSILGIQAANAAEWYMEQFGGETCLPMEDIPTVATRLNLSLNGAILNAPIDMANMFRRKGAHVTEYRQLIAGRVSYKISRGTKPFDIAFDNDLETCRTMTKP